MTPRFSGGAHHGEGSMVLNELVCYWRHCRRRMPAKQLCGTLLRAARVLAYPREHRHLWALPVYRDYVGSPRARNRVHHLAQRDHLRQGLSVRQRIDRAREHHDFDSHHFDHAYLDALYRGDGLELWRDERVGVVFTLRLMRATSVYSEGELSLFLFAGREKVHTLSFSWVQIDSADGRARTFAPFIARNQQRWRREPEPLEQFERAFPHNSSAYFCYAALQGIARVIGASCVAAVNSTAQVCYRPDSTKHFAGAYDGFWETLGGTRAGPAASIGYTIPIPFHVKPLDAVPAKHRKRALQRREHWAAIERSVMAALAPRFIATPAASVAAATVPAPPRATAVEPHLAP
jgi:uncharacterized protein VirK/YbjX